jgi:hypothetical protein
MPIVVENSIVINVKCCILLIIIPKDINALNTRGIKRAILLKVYPKIRTEIKKE